MATQTKVMRFAEDLVESATAEGKRQSRSATQQLDHWARVGRLVSAQQSVAMARIEAVFSGTLPEVELDGEEAVVFNAEVDARIEERLAGQNYGQVLAAEGITTAALDDDGNLVEYRPDGTSRRLA